MGPGPGILLRNSIAFFSLPGGSGPYPLWIRAYSLYLSDIIAEVDRTLRTTTQNKDRTPNHHKEWVQLYNLYINTKPPGRGQLIFYTDQIFVWF